MSSLLPNRTLRKCSLASTRMPGRIVKQDTDEKFMGRMRNQATTAGKKEGNSHFTRDTGASIHKGCRSSENMRRNCRYFRRLNKTLRAVAAALLIGRMPRMSLRWLQLSRSVLVTPSCEGRRNMTSGGGNDSVSSAPSP